RFQGLNAEDHRSGLELADLVPDGRDYRLRLDRGMQKYRCAAGRDVQQRPVEHRPELVVACSQNVADDPDYCIARRREALHPLPLYCEIEENALAERTFAREECL